MSYYTINHTTKAMTLIEILITIVVFTSGILVILSIITGSLTLWRRSRNRTNATMLAKEWLEMMYNVRDTSLDKAQPWSCIPLAWEPCGIDIAWISNNQYTIEATWINNITVKALSLWSLQDARLYITTWSNGSVIYTHTVTPTPSQFYRTITISETSSLGDQSFVNSQIKKIVSRVRYPQLWGTGEIVLESFIGLTRQ